MPKATTHGGSDVLNTTWRVLQVVHGNPAAMAIASLASNDSVQALELDGGGAVQTASSPSSALNRFGLHAYDLGQTPSFCPLARGRPCGKRRLY